MRIKDDSSDSINAVVPVKGLSKSKSRLSSVLQPKERTELTMVMLQDVLSALTKSRMLDSVTVVSTDWRASRIARQFDVSFLQEGRTRGLNNAIRFVVRKRGLSESALLIVHADLPLLTPPEVCNFLKEANGYPIVIAPSKDETGTNAMLLRPARIMQSSFGKESYRRHILMMEQKRILFKVQKMRGFGFDIDEPNDLLDLMNQDAQANTARFLSLIRPGESTDLMIDQSPVDITLTAAFHPRYR